MIKKKSLGQNFLKSKSIIRDIVAAGEITSEELILEVGPGEGAMTEELLLWASKVLVVEKDHRLIPLLNEKFADKIKNGKLEIFEKDILDFDIEKLKSQKIPYKVIANIPYYITGQIIRKFLEADFKPQSMILLLQKEVAERIVARDKKESLLSLSVKIFGEPKIIRTVGRGAFNPQPNVDSAVIAIYDISEKKLEGISSEFFFRVLHAGFSHKRKQLLPNFSSIVEKEKITKAFENLSLDMKVRAEDVSLGKWVQLCKLLNN